MTIDTQKIVLSSTTTASTAFYFASDVNPTIVPELSSQAYIIFNIYGQPVVYSTYTGGELPWIMDNVHGLWQNIPITAITNNYITGYSFIQTFQTILTPTQQNTISINFNNNVVDAMTSSTANNIIIPRTFVFFNTIPLDDMYLNVKLQQTYQTLDTLKIYNNPINSVPQQNANTGIVFGKLQAIQRVLDSNGDNISVPLVNVPIGIFNPTTDYPYPTSVDSNGDRFYLNISEAAEPSQYFDSDSYKQDISFLKTDSQFATNPAKFQYVTMTNENGEFVIYNAPVGPQTIVFEVDLFKQGLTKDEIILNFFPFPTNVQAQIAQLPCYYYNQVPVNVIPAWGNFQTGYTELDISVNLDLRKWTTYIFPPVTFGTQLLQQVVSQDQTKAFKIDVRDMTIPGFPKIDLNIDQIPNDLNRRDGARYLWYNEITQQTQEAQFDNFGCSVIKLPANLYDPDGYRTDQSGNTTSQKGLWLSSYQFKVYSDDTIASRATGGYTWHTSNNVPAFWSHYDLNYSTNSLNTANAPSAIGNFPYEQPWSLTYPAPYSIPAMPTEERFSWDPGRTYLSPYIVEEPAYADGDLVGNQILTETGDFVGGFGVQSYEGVWFPNRTSFVATKSYMYKYEAEVAWNEVYANGFQPYWTSTNQGPYAVVSPLIAGASSVKKGEQYQRLECGYGYYMKYHGWPRIFRWYDIDVPFFPDYTASIGLNNNDPNNPGPGTTPAGLYAGNYQTNESWSNSIYNLENINFALALDSPSFDGIDIYRIVNSGLGDIAAQKTFIIPTFIRLGCGYPGNPADAQPASRLYQFFLTNSGEITVGIPNSFGVGISNPPITVFYTIPVSPGISAATSGDIIYLAPNQSIILGYYDPSLSSTTNQFTAKDVGGNPVSAESALQYANLLLPGNTSFNTQTNRYDTAAYTIVIETTNPAAGTGSFPIYFNPHADTLSVVPQWYIRTAQNGGPGGNGDTTDGISTKYDNSGDNQLIDHLAVDNTPIADYNNGAYGYHGFPPGGGGFAYV